MDYSAVATITKILLIEDEAIIAMDLKQVLEVAGYPVFWAGSVRAACKWLDDNKPLIALIDLKLQGGLSTPVAHELVDRGIPFIVYSGYKRDSIGLDPVFNAGTWLQKPADPASMLSLIHASISAHY